MNRIRVEAMPQVYGHEASIQRVFTTLAHMMDSLEFGSREGVTRPVEYLRRRVLIVRLVATRRPSLKLPVADHVSLAAKALAAYVFA